MTDMKKTALLFVFAVSLIGCNKEISEIPNDDNLVTVNLSLSGEVSTIDEPLTRSGESNALIGIQVYQNESPYAWGLFDSTEGIHLNLHTGSSYSIVCQYIKNGKETLKYFERSSDATVATYILKDQDTYTKTAGTSSHPVTVTVTYWKTLTSGPTLASYNGKYYNFNKYSSGYGAPFNIIDNYNPSGYHEYWCRSYYKKSTNHYERSDPDGTIWSTLTVCSITNGFVYDNTNTINVTSSEVTENQSTNEEIDRYYGESGSFTASSESNRVINLDMKHLVYGIQCNVTGVSDGSASITITNGDETLLYKDNISGEYHSDTKMFAFSDMHGAWQYSDNYTENVTISMKWLRGVGVLQDLGSQVVQVKRNCVNVITVALGTIIASMPQNAQYDSVTPHALSLEASPLFELNNSTIQYNNAFTER